MDVAYNSETKHSDQGKMSHNSTDNDTREDFREQTSSAFILLVMDKTQEEPKHHCADEEEL